MKMTRETVRNLVQHYINENRLSKSEFSKRVGVSDRMVRRLLNSEETISESSLQKMVFACQHYRFAVIGVQSGKVYFRGEYHAECTRWINEQVRSGETLHTSKKSYINMTEPMLIQRLPAAS